MMARTYRDANLFQRAVRASGATAPMSWLYARTLHRIDGPVFRMTHGRTTLSSLLTGLPVVMLTATGARTGAPRTVPLLGVPDGDRLVVIASNYGRPGNPAWYRNLRKQPAATVTVVGGSPRPVRAHQVEGAERERLWARDLEVYPGRAHYAERAAGRRIPVMVLEFVGDGDPTSG